MKEGALYANKVKQSTWCGICGAWALRGVNSVWVSVLVRLDMPIDLECWLGVL